MFNKNFFVLFFGRIIANVGDSLYAVASMWLVYELTQSTFYTGVAGFLTLSPVAFQFLIGPIIDRVNHKLILIVTQGLQAILLSIIPIVHFFGLLNVWIVIIVMPLVVIVGQFAYPTQTAIVPHIVSEKDLTKANSLMNATYQTLDVILQGIAGILIVALGAITIYVVDIITFVLALSIFSLLKLPYIETQKKNNDINCRKVIIQYKADLIEGFLFIKNSFIPLFLIASIVANFAIGAVTAILPEYAYSKGGEHFYGLYLGSVSAGLLIGAICASFFDKTPLGKFTILGFFFSGCSWILSWSFPNAYFSIIFFGLSYIAIGITNIIFLSTIQRILPKEYLGRVFSFIASAITVASPLGALLGGISGTFFGSSLIYMFGGVMLIFVSIYWLLIPTLRNLPSSINIDQKKYGLNVQTQQTVN